MSSLKMTFSLASLVLILGLVFAIAPAMAQEDRAVTFPSNVTIGELAAAAAAGDVDGRFIVIGANPIGGVVDVGTLNAADTGIPDLEERFLVGTTIALLAPAGLGRDGQVISAENAAVQAKDVVISEIMWGLDEFEFGARANQQWIELYNSTTMSATDPANPASATVNMGGWILYFVDEHDTIPTPKEKTILTLKVQNVVELDLLPGDNLATKQDYILVDMVSNLAGGGWSVVTDAGTYGQSGLVVPAEDDSTAAPINIVSMYRNINYENVTKDHKKGKQPDDRNAQLGALQNGGSSGSWKKSTRAFAQNLVGSPGKRHFKGAVTLLSASSVDRSKVIVNEIGNSSKTGEDWVEFRNLNADEPYNLKNNHLSALKPGADPDLDKPKEQEVSLINFKDIDAWIPAGGVLLVLASDPLAESHPIAGGLNIKHDGVTWDATAEEYDIDDDTEHIPTGATSLYYVDDGFEIPDKSTLLILRSGHDSFGSDAGLLDVNGSLSIEDRSADYATNLWPLKKTGKAHAKVVDGGPRVYVGFCL